MYLVTWKKTQFLDLKICPWYQVSPFKQSLVTGILELFFIYKQVVITDNVQKRISGTV